MMEMSFCVCVCVKGTVCMRGGYDKLSRVEFYFAVNIHQTLGKAEQHTLIN